MTKKFKLSERSKNNLYGVHPDLVAVCAKALKITSQDFTVVEGLRSAERQKDLVASGASKTMNSKHIKQADGYGYAIDLYPFYDGKVQVNAPFSKFKEISEAMKKAAQELGVKITWGGDWKSFVDSPHYQLEV